tara:strand:+ start:933 stop:2024 length:1092 start_codon:yes stop_codon:yes gene_type:complete
MKRNYFKKKITFFINSLEVGGTEKHLLQIVKVLKSKYDLNIFAFKGGRLIDLFLKEGVIVTFPKPRQNKLLFFFKFIFKSKADLYHFFLPKSYIIGGIATYFSKKKKIMSRRSLNFYHKKYFNISLFIERVLHKKMDLILTNSNLAKTQLINDEHVKEKKIKLIKNLYKEKNIQKKLRARFNIKDNQVVFAIVANLIPYKGHIDLIKACAKITSDNWKLLIIGEDRNNYLLKLKEAVKKSNLDDEIIFTGFINNVEFFLNDIDFVVNVSTEEGSSNSLLQALAAGIPIVAYNIDSNKDFVENNKNGFLVDYRNINELTKYLNKMVKLGKRRKMGNYSKFIFKKMFSYNESKKDYLLIYDKLIN